MQAAVGLIADGRGGGAADFVGLQERGPGVFGGDVEGFVVHQRRRGAMGHGLLEGGSVGCGVERELGEVGGQADFGAEVGDLGALVGGLFQGQLREQAHRDHFAVQVVCASGGQAGEAHGNGVGRGDAAAFEADAAQEGIGFDYALEGGVNFAAIVGFGGGEAVVEDGLRAQFGDGLGRDGGAAADDGAAGGVAVAGAGLVAGGEGVAHAGHEVAYGRVCDQLGVDEHERRAVRE